MDEATKAALAEGQPPSNVQAEEGLVGAAIRFPHFADEILAAVPADAFYSPATRAIREAIAEVRQGGATPDGLTVANRLDAVKQLGAVVDPLKLVEIVRETVTGANWRNYAAMVMRAYTLRRCIAEAADLLKNAYRGHEPAELIDHWRAAVRDLEEIAAGNDDISPAETGAGKALATVEKRMRSGLPPCVTTGMPDVDRMVGGLFRGNLSVWGGRPSQGKTAAALQVAMHVAKTDPVLFCTIEMQEQELYERDFTAASGVMSDRIRKGTLTDSELERIRPEASRLARLKLSLFDKPSMTVAQIRSAVNRAERRYSVVPSLVVIDYLQLITPENKRATRLEQISQISRELKRLSRETKTHVMACAQLNRSVESRNDGRPQMSDLRECGQIEQDADLIVLIQNPEPKVKDESGTQPATLIVAKNRNGRRGDIDMRYRPRATRFECEAPEPSWPEQAEPTPAHKRNGQHALQGAIDDGDF